MTDLVPTDGLSITSQMGTSLTCPEIVNGSSISPGTGVVCYNGTSVGSIAIYSYICNNDTSQRNETTRVCQSNGTWNGSIPSCISGIITCPSILEYATVIDGLCTPFDTHFRCNCKREILPI